MLTLWLGTALVLMTPPSEPPRIDASSDAAVQASLQRMCESLTDDCKTFMLACDTLVYAEWLARGKKPDLVPLYKPFEGMTAQQVIARAHDVTMKRMAARRPIVRMQQPVGPRTERYPQNPLIPVPAQGAK